MTAVGVVGLGAMGRPIARHLLRCGHQVIAYDTRPEVIEAACALGARGAGSPREVGALSELTLVIVADDAQVTEACLGTDGILAGARRGSAIAILSSVSPETCRTVGGRAEVKGVHVVDAPMMRGAMAAEDGNLLLMVGGDARVVERCRPVFQAFAPDICHLGDLGLGQVGKSVNNLLLWASIVAISEGIGLARALGVDLGALREALQRSSADSWVLREWDRICQIPRWWDQKDLEGVLHLAAEAHSAAPLAATLKELMKPLGPARAKGVFSRSD
jgi:3-hydroxyisobutyrate dehydrogenase-like beta-hydroxyacid dehydrogenase